VRSSSILRAYYRISSAKTSQLTRLEGMADFICPIVHLTLHLICWST
jgi:hypothetical protein